MFKQGSFAEEIMESMESSLIDYQSLDKEKQSKLNEATLLLQKSAQIFKNAEMNNESQYIYNIIKTL